MTTDGIVDLRLESYPSARTAQAVGSPPALDVVGGTSQKSAKMVRTSSRIIKISETLLATRSMSCAARLPERARLAAAEALASARAKRRVAEALFDADCFPEAGKMVADAASCALAAFEIAEQRTHASVEEWSMALAGWGVARAKAARAAKTRVEIAKLPLLTPDESAQDLLFERMTDLCRTIEHALRWTWRTRKERESIRAACVAVVLFTIVILGGFAISRLFDSSPTATASASYLGVFCEPGEVLDNNPETEWLLPENTTGWIELRLKPSRAITGLRLRNSHNHEFNDRATKDYRIELYAGSQLVRSANGSFTKFSQSPTWTTVDLVGANIDRVRIVVLSFFGRGGGLADVTLL